MATTIPSGGGNLILGTNLSENVAGSASNDTIYGYAGDDTITGGNGQDYIDAGIGNDQIGGGLGNDTLIGGAGNDSFNFNGENEGIDRIFSFSSGLDKITINAAGFPGFNAGVLPANLFTTSAFTNTTQRFFFNPTTKEFIYDADGNGSGFTPKTLFFAPNVNILATDIQIVGATSTAFTLELLHASDFEGGLPAIDDAPRFSSVLNALRADPRFTNTVTVSSGDNFIPGPFFAASGDPSPAVQAAVGLPNSGRGDVTILNALGIQASVFGNHEFDLGTNQLGSQIKPQNAYPGTAFPYLSANLNFAPNSDLNTQVTADGQEASTLANKIAKSTVITVNGEKIGIVGVTTPLLPSISSPGTVGVTPNTANEPLSDADLNALVGQIQPAVNALTATGINKVILLSHLQQLENEFALAPKLTNVDVIVAGGSHRLLTDANDRVRFDGPTSSGTYPTIRTSAAGEPIAIVNTPANYQYVGRLVIGFDALGRIVPTTYDPVVSGAYAADAIGVAATGNAASTAKVVEVANALDLVISTKDAVITGASNVYLEGNRNFVRFQETNLGDLSADANLDFARIIDQTAVISLKNGGGIRDYIGSIPSTSGNQVPTKEKTAANPDVGKLAGDISQLDIENSLRFNNGLSLVTVTATQLKQVLEHGVGSGQNQGRWPQLSGVSFSFDLTQPSGSRVRSIAIKDASGNTIDTVVQNGSVVGNPIRTFRLVTLGFLANGGDSYPFLSFATADPVLFNRVNLASASGNTFTTLGGEQRAFADYLTANFPRTAPYNTADVAPALDTRGQNLAARADSVIAGSSVGSVTQNIFGTAGADILTGNTRNNVIVGSGGADNITGGGGNDVIYFSNASQGIDTISDFNIGDIIRVSASGFGAGLVLNGTPILTLGAAVGTSAQFLYSGGVLSFDPDGTNATAASTLATLTGAPALAVSQIEIGA